MAGHILPGDVLLSFDGTAIANDGTILFRRRERISFEHLVTLKVAACAATDKYTCKHFALSHQSCWLCGHYVDCL